MTKLTRGSYGSISFKRSGCIVVVFLPENETHGWCIKAGWAIYSGFKSRRDAVEHVGDYLA